MGIMNKMKTVDLGTLNWRMGGANNPYFSAALSSAPPNTPTGSITIACDRYTVLGAMAGGTFDVTSQNKIISKRSNNTDIMIRDNDYADAAAFKSAMQGVLLTYETIDSVEEEIVSYHPQQLLEEGILSNAGYTSSISFQDNVYTCKTAINTENNGAWRIQALTFQFKGGHKYLISALYRCDEKTLVAFSYSEGVASSIENPISYGSDYARASSICTYSNDRTGLVFFYFDRLGDLNPANEHTVYVKNPIIVDLTALYGAGNEPTSVATFLSQHPEYNSYVPYYDGEINITEEIISPKIFHYTGIGWATRPTSFIDYCNTLPNGNYKVYLTFKLKTKRESFVYGREMYGVRGHQVKWQEGQTEAKMEITTTVPFDISTEAMGYLYGCGNNEIGVTGTADIDIMIATL